MYTLKVQLNGCSWCADIRVMTIHNCCKKKKNRLEKSASHTNEKFTGKSQEDVLWFENLKRKRKLKKQQNEERHDFEDINKAFKEHETSEYMNRWM